MIYWFTGQPGHGKTVLAKKLIKDLNKIYGETNVFHIDGDDIRDLFSNKDYSIFGRINNVNIAQKISHYLQSKNKQIVISLVSPYIDQREDFKKILNKNIIEIYVHTDKESIKESFKSIAYIKPNSNYIDIDNTNMTEEESYQKLKQILFYE
jgi:adenylylsulfate kinase